MKEWDWAVGSRRLWKIQEKQNLVFSLNKINTTIKVLIYPNLGCEMTYLSVNKTNTKALNLYTKLGYDIISER